MAERWRILAVLFAVRLAMAYQFQAVAALSPVYQDAFGIGLADIGLLIGLYLGPGVVLALPGGAVGRRFGDRNVVTVSLVLMVLGGMVMALSPGWGGQLAGRFLAGAGGVALNVVMAKMVTDWFSGREIATAMGVFVNSWPVGIALALVTLPLLAETQGLAASLWVVVAVCALALALLLGSYRDPPAACDEPAGTGVPCGHALRLVLLAGGIWGLYNAALLMVFGFGPTVLTELGWTLPTASGRTSLVLWAMMLSIPAGGWLADRWSRDAVLALGLVGFAIVMAVAAMFPDRLWLFVAMGAVAGLPAGPIMSLPGPVLSPAQRSLGMGIFFTLYYLAVVFGPMLAGTLAETAGGAVAAFWLGVGCLMVCCGLFLAFRRIAAARA